MNPRAAFDLAALKAATAETLIGVDEAGRGSLAGPVVAGATCFTRAFYEKSPSMRSRVYADRIDDSKKLTPAQREAILEQLEDWQKAGQAALAWGEASVEEIEHENIVGATRLAMARALEALADQLSSLGKQLTLSQETDLFHASPYSRVKAHTQRPPLVLIDGRPLKPFPYTHTAVVGGDSQSLAIAAASIIAKVTRDRKLHALSNIYPQYGFENHKGYGTSKHRDALSRHGPCAVHRPRFLKKMLCTTNP